jgi:hypothetical protein
MTQNRNPASGGTLDGAGSDDQAAERVNSEYRSSQSKRKAPSLFEQLVALAHRTRIALEDADGFQHAYGPDRPPGRGWWSPVEEGCQHYVRSARRRVRS